ncbi:phage Tail Collar [Candidatus Koribacter versatilis Ellin345]|uniref:Phage Tail Collar n=1 Tax=Koribacter versatilis (strain Ellin345) TaxID=204669 RepID=Q1INU5_KORVE|nr:tail fiber protein [Candidatus Koribacter versatilis]ABF41455.1 phage Tail Collar [Candidatus Koribacter versatilis Ellin345]
MSNPFLCEIRIVSFNFAPKGWAFCNGQILPINQNQALFSLMGTTYGGNGTTNFALPNLQGRTPFHTGSGFTLGQVGGEQNHTLIITEMPAHTHNLQVNSVAADASSAVGSFFGNAGASNYAATADTSMASGAIASAGGGQPHNNLSPYLVLNFVVALVGIFPSRN